MRSRSTHSLHAGALLVRERGIPPLPPSVRARALARARTALRTGAEAAPALPHRSVGKHWIAAAALLCVASAALGAAAYEIRALLILPPSVLPVEAAPASPLVSARITNVRSAPARAARTSRSSPALSLRMELRLLGQARVAVAGDDFEAALTSIAAHARRFKDGRLAEEREALRVAALLGLGRIEEARRAGVGFEERFPRSVLLPAVKDHER